MFFRSAFLPHIEETYKEVNQMIDYPSPDVRKAALKALEQHCVAIANIAKEAQTGQVYSGMK